MWPYISVMKQRFVVTHTIRQTEILALLEAGLQTHLLVESPYIFLKA